MDFGDRLKARRNHKNLSQRALAEMTGLTDGYISMLETDKRSNPSYDVIKQLATALQCTVNYLVDGKEHSEAS